jgi:CheY-like chemotaxis protein
MNAPVRALIVDDEPIAQKVHSVLLRQAGFHTTTANDGEEAIKLVNQQTFDILLVDINMPRMNGIEFTQLIRQSEGTVAKLPIIGITGHCGSDEIQKAKAAGMNEVLTKPITGNTLQNCLSNFLKTD